MKTSVISGISKHWDFVVIDIVALAIAFCSAYYIKFRSLNFIDSATWRALFFLLVITNLIITLVTNPYSGIFKRRYWEDIGKQLLLAMGSFIVICVMFYLIKSGEDYSREMFILTYAIYAALATILKYMHKRMLLVRWRKRPADSLRRVIIVSCARNSQNAVKMCLADDINATAIVGYCFPKDDLPPPEIDASLVINPSQLISFCLLHSVDEVLICDSLSIVPREVIEQIMENGISVRIAISESLKIESEYQSIGHLGVFKTLDLRRYSFGNSQIIYLPLKRVLDLAVGMLGCAVLIPVAGVVKISYLITGDTHPIFYRQQRVGRHGETFEIWKLRSMVWNAEEILQKMLQDPKVREEWNANQKLNDDPRITSVGSFIRKTSIDELPQFINVIAGDMSVVGPRPLIPGELEEHGGIPLYNMVRPGITGWWGCNGRSDIEYKERLELEYYYVKNCSLYLDALCVLRTIGAIVKKTGAR